MNSTFLRQRLAKLAATIAILTAGNLAVPIGAEARVKIGNGGGAWICREPNGSLRWLKVVDLYEAEAERGLKISDFRGRYEDIVDQIRSRVARVDAGLSRELTPYFSDQNYLRHAPPKVHHTRGELEYIDDVLYSVRPPNELCRGGNLISHPQTGEKMIPYTQIVNFKPDGTILVQGDRFTEADDKNRAGELNKASLSVHEPVYAYLRKVYGDTDSRRTREIVGLLFSTLSDKEIGTRLNTILSATKRLSIQAPRPDAKQAAQSNASRPRCVVYSKRKETHIQEGSESHSSGASGSYSSTRQSYRANDSGVAAHSSAESGRSSAYANGTQRHRRFDQIEENDVYCDPK